MPKWTVTLDGDSWDLEILTGLYDGVSQEGSAFVLRDPQFDNLTDAGVVRDRAIELVEMLTGLARSEDDEFGQVQVGAVACEQGPRMHSVYVTDTIRTHARSRV